LCNGDILLLALLRAAPQQNHKAISLPPKIYPVARAPIDPPLRHPATDWLDFGEIARGPPFQCQQAASSLKAGYRCSSLSNMRST